MGREEVRGFRGEGTHVCLWMIHVDLWQNPSQYCKVIICQLSEIFEKADALLTISLTCIPSSISDFEYGRDGAGAQRVGAMWVPWPSSYLLSMPPASHSLSSPLL